MSRRGKSSRATNPGLNLSGLITDPLRTSADDVLTGTPTWSSAEDTCGKCGGSNGSHMIFCVSRVGD